MFDIQGGHHILVSLLAVEDPRALAISEKMPALALLPTSMSLVCDAALPVDNTLGTEIIDPFSLFTCVDRLFVHSRIVTCLGHLYTIFLLYPCVLSLVNE